MKVVSSEVFVEPTELPPGATACGALGYVFLLFTTLLPNVCCWLVLFPVLDNIY